MTCWLRDNGVYNGLSVGGWWFTGECEGRTDPVHLIPQQLLKRELGSRKAGYEMLVVAGCRKHHHLLDISKNLRIPRDRLPESVETFAREHGLEWWLTREYGERAERAA